MVVRPRTGRLIVAALLASLARADVQFVNRTIDDQLGDEDSGRLVRQIARPLPFVSSAERDSHILSSG